MPVAIAMPDTLPMVTIAMPCLDEERYIEACLRTVLAQDYPADRLEIIVADGGSRDRTRELVARICAVDSRVQLVDNPLRVQAAAMNEVIRRARGEIVVRMDIHAEYAPDYVRCCVAVLERTGADNAGGAQRARAETPFQRALCAALTSPLGMGGARYRSPDAEGWVDTVFLGAFRRSVFDRVGGYDPGAVTNEDAELNQRIIEAGGRIYLSPDIVVHYAPRDSFRKLAVQYFRYGRGRARTILKHGRLLSLRGVIPFLMVMIGAALLASWPVNPLAPVAFGAYAAIALGEGVRVAYGLGSAGVARAALIFPLLHTSHGLGFAAGLLRYAGRPDWQVPDRLPAHEARALSPREGPRSPTNWKVRVTKRAIDLFASAIGLIVAAPIFPLLAIAIKLDSSGPVFYRQKRAGALIGVERVDGRTQYRFVFFWMPKFRTMCQDAERTTGAIIAQKGDPRVTRVGRFLRKTRLDELPQLWSVLIGEMSLVGPRPERPELLNDLALAIPLFEERMRGVKPGLTGLAQTNLGYSGEPLPGTEIALLQAALTNPFKVEGTNGAVADAMRIKLLYDLAYAATLDDLKAYLLTELEIIFKTPVVMIKGMGR